MADNDEQELPKEPEDEEEYPEPPSGIDEMFYALADALRAKRSKEAIAALIEQYAAEFPVVAKRRHTAMLWSYGFTLLVFLAVGVLGWLKIISAETASTLIGTVIGAVFYGRRLR